MFLNVLEYINFLFQSPKLWIAISLMIFEICFAVVDDDDNVLHIGGIFPIGGKGGWQGGQVIYIFLLFS